MTLVSVSASIIRRVIVVFPEPVPPHIPIINGLLSSGGRFSDEIARSFDVTVEAEYLLRFLNALPSMLATCASPCRVSCRQSPLAPQPAVRLPREMATHSRSPCPLDGRISRCRRRRHARRRYQSSVSGASPVPARSPIRRAFLRQQHREFERGPPGIFLPFFHPRNPAETVRRRRATAPSLSASNRSSRKKRTPPLPRSDPRAWPRAATQSSCPPDTQASL